jgi:hypothetical protein
MAKVKIKKEDLDELINHKIITDFQFSVLTRVLFEGRRINELADSWKIPREGVVEAYKAGYKKLIQYYKIREKNDKLLKENFKKTKK